MKNMYQMPKPNLGPCLWYPSRDTAEAVPAMITAVGYDNVNLSVFPPDNRGSIPKDGVRHISDPQLFEHPGYDAGCWDYTDQDKKLFALVADVAKLKKDLGVSAKS